MSLTLPDANISKVIGLLQVLAQHGGDHETFSLANDLQLHAENFLPVTEAAELLGFIAISGGRMKLTSEGRKAIAGGIRERRLAVKERLLLQPVFKKALEYLQRKNGRCSKKSFQKALLGDLPKPQAESTLRSVIGWGRHASLIGYNSDTDEVFVSNSD